ncbi:MAG: hypothetical protein JWO86_2754 [Myxococcaceae bacterium]|nr:hypothetical protein [Myxococcaceae bacterium]
MMKTRWLSLFSFSLAGAIACLDASGCSNGSSDTTPTAGPDDASQPDGSVESSDAVDAGLDGNRGADSNIPCGPTQFCPTALPGSPAPSLTGIFAASANRVVGITGDGQILLWDGSTWSALAQGYGSLAAVWGIDADHFLIAEAKSWSLTTLTFHGAANAFDIGQETLPYDSNCAPASISISGTSATDIYVAGYCRFYDSDVNALGFTGVLFHSTAPDGGVGTSRSWSLRWSAGGPTLEPTALGSVYAVSPGEAFVGGWKSRPEQFPNATMLKTPGAGGDPTQPGTTAFVLHVKDNVIVKEDLAPSLAMCVQSIWSSPSADSLFIGGLCSSIDTTDKFNSETKYTTVAHRGPLPDGGVGWTAAVREPFATFFDLPAMLLGFGTADVYAAGSYLTHWDGTTFQLVETATNGSPPVGRVRGLHGTSTRDFWMVGDRFASHRKQ